MSEVEVTSRPPLGSWPKFYVLTCIVASLYIFLLWWFTAAFNHPGGAS